MATYHLDSLNGLRVVRDDSDASVLEAQTLAALMHDRAKREGANLRSDQLGKTERVGDGAEIGTRSVLQEVRASRISRRRAGMGAPTAAPGKLRTLSERNGSTSFVVLLSALTAVG